MNHVSPSSERGFTLAEVMVTIVILGVLAAIAIPSWWSVIDARRVDSATNQVAADLRLAHNSAINRLASRRVATTAASNTYQTGPVGALNTHSLPDGTRTATAATVTFCPDGSAELATFSPSCPNGTATVAGNPATVTIAVPSNGGAPSRSIEVSRANSRINVD